MRSTQTLGVALALSLLAAAPGCGKDTPEAGGGDAPMSAGEPATLTVYSGRSKAMVHGLFDAFSKKTGVEVKVRYGKTAGLANTILEEGDASPADVFFSQDAGALGALAQAGRFEVLPAAVLDKVDARFRGEGGLWVGTSGRARVITYNAAKLKPEDLPKTIDGFTAPEWKGRIGWPPTNASFQAFVTALRKVRGDEGAAKWLAGVQANEPRVYPKNTPAVKAVAAGEIDVAFVNHYYRHRLAKEAGGDYPAANYHPPGDLGAMMNVAGAGVLKTSQHKDAAMSLVAFLLSDAAQRVYAQDNFEYPLAGDVEVAPGVAPLDTFTLPEIDLGSIDDLEGTMKLLRKVKVLP